MCGRFGLTASWEELRQYYSIIPPTDDGPPMPPRYNIAPTQPIAVIASGPDGERVGKLVRWGLVPSWVRDPNDFTLIINARSETAIEKPSFRNAMRHRRILIPASGFYEWQRFGKKRKSQPYWVHPREHELLAFGGLMEMWSGADGTEIDTACILTTEANDNFRSIHDRLPLVIEPDNIDQWLDCKTQEPRDVVHLMQPAADNYFEPVPVSDAVNRVANSDASVQERVEPAVDEPETEAPTESQMKLF